MPLAKIRYTSVPQVKKFQNTLSISKWKDFAEAHINHQEDHFHCTTLYPPGPKSEGDNAPLTAPGCAAHESAGAIPRLPPLHCFASFALHKRNERGIDCDQLKTSPHCTFAFIDFVCHAIASRLTSFWTPHFSISDFEQSLKHITFLYLNSKQVTI